MSTVAEVEFAEKELSLFGRTARISRLRGQHHWVRRRIMNKLTGNHIVVLQSQMVMAANEIEATADGAILRLGGMESRVAIGDIAKIYKTGSIDRFPIDPAILSTLATLEAGIRKYEAAGGRRSSYTICGGASLALTIIPNRTTEDIDVIARDPIEEFLAKESMHWDYAVEFLDETVLTMMGNWRARTSTAIGPTGLAFQLMHPLDTIMQKLLRWNDRDFAQRDCPDIEKIIAVLKPSEDSLKKLLIENPYRYSQAAGPMSVATEAIERNTRWFLAEFLPDTSYEKLPQLAYVSYRDKLGYANLLPLSVPGVDLSTKIEQVPLDLG